MRFPKTFISSVIVGIVSLFSLTPAFASTEVTVQQGNTLWTLSQNYGVSLESLEDANPSVNPYNLLPGTAVQIPNATGSNDSENLYWLEHVINAEAGGESLEAQIAVGDVVLHRVEVSNYPNSIKDVVFQQVGGHYQFSCVPNGYIYQTPNSSSVEAAKEVLEQRKEVVPGALVFFNPAQTANGNWVWSQPRIAEIGHFIFAK